MNKVLEFLSYAAGALLAGPLYIVALLLQFAPLIFLHFPFWGNFLAVILMTCVPFVNIVASLIIWVWALIEAIKGPQDIFAIVYYVLFAFNTLRILLIVSTGVMTKITRRRIKAWDNEE